MLSASNISKLQNGVPLYTGGNFQINPGEKVGLVGPNGAGKTTLFRLIIKEDKPDTGQISFPKDMRLAYFSQNVGEMAGKTALQEVVEGDEKVAKLQKEIAGYEEQMADYESLSDDDMNDLMMKMGEAQTEFEKLGGYDLESRAEEVLTGLGIKPEDHHKDVKDFSGGWKMRIALAKVLVRTPDIILMDEPTNYLDLETILWLEEWLNNFKGAIFMTTHDRGFMNNVCNKTIEIAHKKITTFSGNYDFYEKEKDIRLTQLKAEAASQAEMLRKEEEFIAKFKARASHAAQVQSRVKKLEKIERIEIPAEEETINFEFPKPERGGDDVIVMEELAKSWSKTTGEEVKVFQDLNSTVKRLDKIAVVGVNGAGKSTLLKTITGLTDPTQGKVTIGPSIKFGYFGQHTLDVLDANNSVFDEVQKGLPHASDGFIRNLLAAFLFRGDDVEKKVRFLSGGEKARLVLATIMSQKNNLLILDEPTNHLDIKSREVLLNSLKKFEGTILFVSHDRHFLHELSEKVFEVDKQKITIYPGNYTHYLEKTT